MMRIAFLVTTLPADQAIDWHDVDRIVQTMYMNDEKWKRLAVYSDAASAEAVAGLLRGESVRVRIAPDEPVPGLVNAIRLMVPAASLHRAKAILAQPPFSDEELSSIATSTPGEEGPP